MGMKDVGKHQPQLSKSIRTEYSTQQAVVESFVESFEPLFQFLLPRSIPGVPALLAGVTPLHTVNDLFPLRPDSLILQLELG